MPDNFESGFEDFMRALAAKNRSAFKKFLDKKVYSFAILPPSRTYDTLDAYRASQDHWFDGATGSFDYTVKLAQESGAMALGLVQAVYKNTSTDGKPFTLNLWISFVFKKCDAGWKLVFCQNTQIF